MVEALRQDPSSTRISDFLKRTAMPGLGIPVWAMVFLVLAGVGGVLLIWWATSCLYRWFSFSEPVDAPAAP